MKCVYHNDREAEYVCSECGQPVCKECITSINGKNVCRTCALKIPQYNTQYNQVYRRGDGISGFLFFIFLAVPGIRHMYIGLMKRGLEFLVGFFGVIAFGTLLGNPGVIVLPVLFLIWFYSAFDSYNCRKFMSRGEKVEDKPVLSEYSMTDIKSYISQRKSLAGICVMILGIFLLFKQIRAYSWRFHIPQEVLQSIDLAFDSIIPILLIAGGIYLMNKSRKSQPAQEE